MKEFFKPTGKKIILSLAIVLLLFFAFLWFFNVSPVSIPASVPNCITDPSQPQFCMPSSHPIGPSIAEVIPMVLVVVMWMLVVSYLLSCTIVALFKKLKKQQKPYASKLKK